MSDRKAAGDESVGIGGNSTNQPGECDQDCQLSCSSRVRRVSGEPRRQAKPCAGGNRGWLSKTMHARRTDSDIRIQNHEILDEAGAGYIASLVGESGSVIRLSICLKGSSRLRCALAAAANNALGGLFVPVPEAYRPDLNLSNR